MNLESVILSEVNWTAKEKYCIASLIRGIQKELIQMKLQNPKRIDTNEVTYKTKRDSQT